MKTVNTLTEAMIFFLENSSGSVVCKSNGNTKMCSSYPEAELFFLKDKDKEQEIKVIGVSISGPYCAITMISCDKDGKNLEYKTNFVNEAVSANEIVRFICNFNTNLAVPVVVNSHGMGRYIYELLHNLIGANAQLVSLTSKVDLLGASNESFEQFLCNTIKRNNPSVLAVKEYRAPDRVKYKLTANEYHEDTNAELNAVLAAYSLVVGTPSNGEYIVKRNLSYQLGSQSKKTDYLKAKRDEYIEIKGDGYYIKFKVSDLNCGKGIDYNVETGQLIISKLPDDVVEQLKDIFSDIEPLESAKRSSDEIMGKDLKC